MIEVAEPSKRSTIYLRWILEDRIEELENGTKKSIGYSLRLNGDYQIWYRPLCQARYINNVWETPSFSEILNKNEPDILQFMNCSSFELKPRYDRYTRRILSFKIKEVKIISSGEKEFPSFSDYSVLEQMWPKFVSIYNEMQTKISKVCY